VADMIVANTILRQLGGNRFAAMTGAKNFVGSKDALNFKIGRNAAKIASVNIRLNNWDLYDMTFYRANCKIENVEEMICADDLERIFTSNTGMDTRL